MLYVIYINYIIIYAQMSLNKQIIIIKDFNTIILDFIYACLIYKVNV